MKSSTRFRDSAFPRDCHAPHRSGAARLAGTFILLATLAACSRPDAPPPPETGPSVPVRVVTVEVGTHRATEEVVGTVRARLRASLEARISGRIQRFHAVPGQLVESGDVLVELDARGIQAQVEQTIARRQQTEQDLRRFKALLDQNAVTRAEFDDVQTRFLVAHAAATEAQTMLDHARVVAPFSGVVTRTLADVGDLAQPGRALLELEDPRQLRFEAHVPESLFGRIQPNAKLSIRIPALHLEQTGTVTEIAPFTDPLSRTSLVKLDLPGTPGLRSGQFGRLLVPTADRAALRVPAAAVIRRGQLELLFVVQNDHAHLRLVKTGKQWDDQVELVSGIQAGETIVAAGAEALRDGQSVTVLP